MHLEVWHLGLLAAIGIVAGILNVVAGGGSLLTLPTMIFMGLPEAVANGTNRLAIFAQNISAVSGFQKQGFSNFKLSATLALAAIPGAVMGAYMGAVIRGTLFNRILALVMIAAIVWMFLEERFKKSKAPQRSSTPPPSLSRARAIGGHLGMVAVGFYGGFIQAGVGFLLIAVLNTMSLDLVRVNMHKVFIVASFTLIALIVFILHGKVWWIPGFCLAIGNSLGGWIGSQLAVARGEAFIRKILHIALAAMAIKLLFD
jgi:hypothetical protein